MADDYLLMEDGDFLLLEDDGLILLDSAADVTYWTGGLSREYGNVSPGSYQMNPSLKW